MPHAEIQVTDTTPLLLRRAQEVHTPEVHATSRHDHSTTTQAPTQHTSSGGRDGERMDSDTTSDTD